MRSVAKGTFSDNQNIKKTLVPVLLSSRSVNPLHSVVHCVCACVQTPIDFPICEQYQNNSPSLCILPVIPAFEPESRNDDTVIHTFGFAYAILRAR